MSGGVATGVIGCGDHDGDGTVWCYLSEPSLCDSAMASVTFGAAVGWVECHARVIYGLCTDEGCAYAHDGTCDDGGTGATYASCAFGSDCNDCGLRNDPHATCDDALLIWVGDWAHDQGDDLSAIALADSSDESTAIVAVSTHLSLLARRVQLQPYYCSRLVSPIATLSERAPYSPPSLLHQSASLPQAPTCASSR